MTVPKKKISKSRRDSRKSYWRKKVVRNVLIAISLGKSIKSGKPDTFVLNKNFDGSLVNNLKSPYAIFMLQNKHKKFCILYLSRRPYTFLLIFQIRETRQEEGETFFYEQFSNYLIFAYSYFLVGNRERISSHIQYEMEGGFINLVLVLLLAMSVFVSGVNLVFVAVRCSSAVLNKDDFLPTLTKRINEEFRRTGVVKFCTVNEPSSDALSYMSFPKENVVFSDMVRDFKCEVGGYNLDLSQKAKPWIPVSPDRSLVANVLGAISTLGFLGIFNVYLKTPFPIFNFYALQGVEVLVGKSLQIASKLIKNIPGIPISVKLFPKNMRNAFRAFREYRKTESYKLMYRPVNLIKRKFLPTYQKSINIRSYNSNVLFGTVPEISDFTRISYENEIYRQLAKNISYNVYHDLYDFPLFKEELLLYDIECKFVTNHTGILEMLPEGEISLLYANKTRDMVTFRLYKFPFRTVRVRQYNNIEVQTYDWMVRINFEYDSYLDNSRLKIINVDISSMRTNTGIKYNRNDYLNHPNNRNVYPDKLKTDHWPEFAEQEMKNFLHDVENDSCRFHNTVDIYDQTGREPVSIRQLCKETYEYHYNIYDRGFRSVDYIPYQFMDVNLNAITEILQPGMHKIY